MSASALKPGALREVSVPQRSHYLNWSFSVKDWLLTLDHKRIAILYLVSITIMFGFGGWAGAGPPVVNV